MYSYFQINTRKKEIDKYYKERNRQIDKKQIIEYRMYRDKSLKQFKLHQLLSQDYSLINVSGSGGTNTISHSFSSINLINPNNNLSPNILPTSGQNRVNNSNEPAIINKQGKYMHFHRQSQKQQQASLIKSKQVLQKFNNKLSSLPVQKYPHSSSIDIVKTQIQQTTHEIGQQINKKIDQSFTQILNTNTLIPIMSPLNNQPYESLTKNINNQKQNSSSSTIMGLSLNQGTKLLMNDYWQKQKVKKPSSASLKKSQSQIRLNFTLQNQSNLPKINQKAFNITKTNQKIILGKVSSKNEKIRQQLQKSKDYYYEQQKLQLLLTFKADIVDYKIQNQTTEFLTFQRVNFKKWEDILFVLNCIESFCSKYNIESGRIDLKRVLELVDEGDKKQQLKQAFSQQQQPRGSPRRQINNMNSLSTTRQFTSHQLLSCFDNAEQISEQHPNSKGIRFYGQKGKLRAIIKIQSHFRKHLCQNKLKQLKSLMSKILLIQKKYRQYLLYTKTKTLILQRQMNRIQRFKKIQEQFCQNYRHKQMTKRVKYEIHICSIGGSEWLRVSTQNLNERQNVQLSRIYRIATKTSALMQTRVIYIAPCQLSKDIVNYYKKIFQFGSVSQSQQQNNPYSDKLTILWPENVQKLPQTLSLTQKVLYSKTTINKIKRIIRDNYSYIVPSIASVQYISLCNQLNVPIYCSQPQKLLYLQTQGGMKQFAQVLKQCKDDTFGVLPYSSNLYNKTAFINELTFLVMNYPNVKRWVLKIDNQNHSRGLAFVDTSKILKTQIISKLFVQNNSINTKQKVLKQQIFDKLYQSLITFKQQRIIPVTKQVYQSQQQYLNHFLAYGGIIQASINNFQTDLENHSFTVEIQPDLQWKFVTSYYKITHKNKTVAAYYDCQANIQPPIQIQYLVKQLIRRKLFGFFTFDFTKIPNNKTSLTDTNQNTVQETSSSLMKNEQKSIPPTKKQSTSLLYFNGLKCHLDEFSSASFLKQFLSKDTNVLYVPFLSHPSLKQLRIQTFFHLCRLENISFDIKRKIGNVFMFLNGLESGCMGLMSFNGDSKEETFQQVSDVLQFLSSKLNQTKQQLKSVPKEFMSIRNVVNGYLKRTRDNKLIRQLKESKSTSNMNRTLSRKQLI